MNVVVASDLYFPTLGGISVATHELVIELAKKGHNVSLIAPAISVKNSVEKISNHLTIYRISSLLLLPEKRIRFVLDIKKIVSLIKKINPDIIHAMTPAVGTIGLTSLIMAKKKHIPIIATHHLLGENFTSHLHLPFIFKKNLGKITMQYIKRIFQQMDYIIVPSESGAAYLRTLGINTPITVISNGLSVKKFEHPSKKMMVRLKQRYHLDNKRIILYTGRLDNEKGIDILLKAFLTLLPSFNIYLLIVGIGMEAKQIRKYIEKQGLEDNIILTGPLSDSELIAIYHLADIYVMPSAVELQSISTMEAMAAKLPIIGANAMALPHLIHSDENGLLFEPGNSHELAEKLKILLTNKTLRQKMQEKSFIYIQEHAIEKIIVKFENLYRSLLLKRN